MCGPLKAWKWAIYITSILIIAIGIAFLIATVIVADKEFIKAVEIEKMVRVFGIVFGAVMIVIGLVGFLSASCESTCLVFIVILFYHA